MPYISKNQRAYFEAVLASLDRTVITGSGELNYLLTEIIQAYMRSNSKSYAVMNDVVGALDCCKEEFRRRIVNPYEDYKIETNGDVYQPEVLK